MTSSSPAQVAPKLKLVVRRLPPQLPQSVFEASIAAAMGQLQGGQGGEGDGQLLLSSLGIDWLHYRPGRLASSAFKLNVPSVALLHFTHPDHLLAFYSQYNGHCFISDNSKSTQQQHQPQVGSSGQGVVVEYRALVELAPFQRIPKPVLRKEERYVNTIDQDETYLAFLKSLEKSTVTTLDGSTSADQPGSTTTDSSSAPTSNLIPPTSSSATITPLDPKSTPLLEELRARKAALAKREALPFVSIISKSINSNNISSSSSDVAATTSSKKKKKEPKQPKPPKKPKLSKAERLAKKNAKKAIISGDSGGVLSPNFNLTASWPSLDGSNTQAAAAAAVAAVPVILLQKKNHQSRQQQQQQLQQLNQQASNQQKTELQQSSPVVSSPQPIQQQRQQQQQQQQQPKPKNRRGRGGGGGGANQPQSQQQQQTRNIAALALSQISAPSSTANTTNTTFTKPKVVIMKRDGTSSSFSVGSQSQLVQPSQQLLTQQQQSQQQTPSLPSSRPASASSSKSNPGGRSYRARKEMGGQSGSNG